jgi:phytoene/squalene synthetase
MCESCQEQLEQQRARIAVLEAFVKEFDTAWDEYEAGTLSATRSIALDKAREAVGVVK